MTDVEIIAALRAELERCAADLDTAAKLFNEGGLWPATADTFTARAKAVRETLRLTKETAP